MIAARSASVIVRGTTSGGGSGGGAMRGEVGDGAGEQDRIEDRRIERASAGERGGVGDARLAPEQADPPERLVGQPQAGVAMGAVEEQPRPKLGLRVDAFVRQGRRDR